MWDYWSPGDFSAGDFTTSMLVMLRPLHGTVSRFKVERMPLDILEVEIACKNTSFPNIGRPVVIMGEME